ncbi:probable inactive 2-oxoglutarate-dependent dioxygenase AOP2 [Cajanus cajan]|uniref:Gibberellin 20 oxidase 1 n=1 Tax=Cajanus cajan TaxID=3821 RepID=A0A151SYG6_CAJCA|nr:probable inactive 2-oxoglutarate-dependent dioxygenase AOP2 [Cajanus cajan]KYP59859.1 Gibberellin 20 oxidase 1 [Cajanus cajan]
MGSEGQPMLPVLDFTMEDLKPGTNSWLTTCRRVRQAFEEYGCFVAVYDKASVGLQNGVFGSMKELFDLPAETKQRNIYEGMPLKGYVGQRPQIPLHESMGIDEGTTLEGIQNFIQKMWPNGNDQFCKYIFEYAKLAEDLDRMVARMIFESYGVLKHYDTYIGSTSYLLRLLAHKAPEQVEQQLGFVAHTDKSFTTILHQNQVNGLMVETRDGHWIDVDFSSPTSFVVMAGDALMAWSNDRIKSPNHKVLMKGNEIRYSLGLFAFYKGIMQVPEELIDEEHPLQYKPFDHLGLLNFTYSANMKAYCGV